MKLDEDEIAAILLEADTDGDRNISYDEFKQARYRRIHPFYTLTNDVADGEYPVKSSCFTKNLQVRLLLPPTSTCFHLEFLRTRLVLALPPPTFSLFDAKISTISS